MSAAQIIRRADIKLRRAVRNVHLAVCALPVKLAMRVTMLANHLPTSREVQDGAMYAAAFAGLVLLASGVWK